MKETSCGNVVVIGVYCYLISRFLLEYCNDKSLFPYNTLLDSGIKSLYSKFIKELPETDLKRRPAALEALNHE